MDDYDGTPSFYTTTETFEKYLGQTSYYLTLQANVAKLVAHANPDRLTEMGSGTGATAVRLADEFPETEVLGIDNRETVVDVSRNTADELDLPNLAFETAEMTEYVASATSLPEMIVCLYSFHHIPDPLQRKVEFLENCHVALPERGHLCIAETFLTTALVMRLPAERFGRGGPIEGWKDMHRHSDLRSTVSSRLRSNMRKSSASSHVGTS